MGRNFSAFDTETNALLQIGVGCRYTVIIMEFTWSFNRWVKLVFGMHLISVNVLLQIFP